MNFESKERSAWSRTAKRTFSTNRSTNWYDTAFNITSGENPVLDLGSGKSDYAPPNMIRTDYRYRNSTPAEGNNVACLFQELPFADSSFKRVTASWSLFALGTGAKKAIDEGLRVLDTGGEFQIYPTNNRLIKKHAKKLEESGVTRRERIKMRSNKIAVALTGGAITIPVDLVAGSTSLKDIATSVIACGTVLSLLIYLVEKIRPDYTLTIQRGEELSDPQARKDFVDNLFSAYHIAGLRRDATTQ